MTLHTSKTIHTVAQRSKQCKLYFITSITEFQILLTLGFCSTLTVPHLTPDTLGGFLCRTVQGPQPNYVRLGEEIHCVIWKVTL